MDQNEGDESAPLVVLLNAEEGSPSEVGQGKIHARDAQILTFAFFFIFCANVAAQNLESTVNSGIWELTSLGILYTSFTLFFVVASPIVRELGMKKALVLGRTGYLLFIASNMKPSWYTMVPASLYLGFTESIIWVSQGTYLTSAARSHARDCHLHEGTVIGDFNGEFWGLFASTNVIVNLVSLFFLGEGKEGGSSINTSILFTVFLGRMVLGAILMCFLSARDDEWEGQPAEPSVGSILKSVIAPLFEARVLLIIPLLAYSGLQQAFVCAEFTKRVLEPALGVSGVGGAMAVYGAGDAIDAAFAQLKLWQSGAIAAIYFLSPYISLQAMLMTMVAALCVALSGFLYLTLHVERSFSTAS